MYTELFMAKLAKESIKIWDDLEAEAAGTPGEKVELIQRSGLLNFGNPQYSDGPEGNLMDPIKNLDLLGLKYRLLTADDIMAEYPFKNLPKYY